MTFDEWCSEYAKREILYTTMDFRRCWTAAQESMRERAAVSQCYHCQQGKPIDHIDGGRAFHLDSKGCPTYCMGQAIRDLPVE